MTWHDEAFSCIVKSQKRRSNKIYKNLTHRHKDIKSSNVQVSGRSTKSRVDFNRRVDLVKLRFKRGFKEVKIRYNEQ